MEERKVHYYKGKFYSQFSAAKPESLGGQYKQAQIQLEQRFRLVVDREITRDEYFAAREERLSDASLDWQKQTHLRHISHEREFQIEPHVLLKDAHYLELEKGKEATRVIASEIYVEFQPDWAGNAYQGFEFIAQKDGLWHGRLEGFGYCAVPELSQEEEKLEIEQIELRDSWKKNAGCLGGIASLQNRGGCNPMAMLLSPARLFGGSSGCLKGGCGKIGCGLLGLLGLLLLALGLLKGCSEQMEKNQGPRVIHDTVYVDEKSKEDIIKKFMDTTTISKTEAIELPNVQFYTNSAKLLPYSINSIQQLAEYMNAHPKIHATIVGHTDNVGEAEANLNLSQSRAETVKQVLLSFGVDGSRVDAVGKGETAPRTTNDTVEGRALNRRVEVRLTKTEDTETKSEEVDE
jgi:outer membrane protein OmpA-like peptidoglycan-associated protein